MAVASVSGRSQLAATAALSVALCAATPAAAVSLRVELPSPSQDVLSAIIEAAPAVGLRVREQDAEAGRVIVSAGITWTHWGGTGSLLVREMDPARTAVEFYFPPEGTLIESRRPNQQFDKLMAAVATKLGVPAVGAAQEVAGAGMPLVEPVVSPVYEAIGDVPTLALSGQTCIAQIVRPGFTTAETIMSSDPTSGVVVARNAYGLGAASSYGATQGRSVMTFEAKAARFRITHTSVEEFMESTGWRPSLAWSKEEREAIRKRLNGISAAVADCVKAASTKQDEW